MLISKYYLALEAKVLSWFMSKAPPPSLPTPFSSLIWAAGFALSRLLGGYKNRGLLEIHSFGAWMVCDCTYSDFFAEACL